MDDKSIKLIDSGKPGPTVAIFGGIHGNERAGVYAVEALMEGLVLKKGKVYLVLANPSAIEANVRMLEKNLNRCFFADNDGGTPEDLRALELMKILDECDALLDLHMFYDDDGEPFIICEDEAVGVAKIFDVGIISTNWAEVEPGGTDSYMYSLGRIGICLECGPISKAEEYTDFAIDAAEKFLNYFGLIEKAVKFSEEPKKIIRAEKTIYKSSENFVLKPGLKNFDLLESGQLLATDGDVAYVAGKDECIIFPHYAARVEEEAYILGKLEK